MGRVKMSGKQTVMIVEDEASIGKFVSTILKANNYLVITAANGADARGMASSHMPDLILLDLGLPDIDGIEVIKDIRKWSNIPIIVVSARDRENDKVTALDVGADDYITKPFGTSELLARIRTALRHKRTTFDDEIKSTKKFDAKGLCVDFDKHEVTVHGKPVHFTNIEFKIIEMLCKYSGKVLTYDYILKEIWGPYAKEDNKILRVNMANIRRKIEENPAEPQYVFTEAGVGYRMIEAN